MDTSGAGGGAVPSGVQEAAAAVGFHSPASGFIVMCTRGILFVAEGGESRNEPWIW